MFQPLPDFIQHPGRLLPRLLFLMAGLSPLTAQTGPYPAAAGQAGSTAIHKSSARFVNWANQVVSYQPGSSVDTVWQNTTKACGPPGNDVYDILCLGNGGSVTMGFPHPIRNDSGADFAVFENAFSDYFIELAFVEVSSDGVHFHRFPTTSLWEDPVGQFGDLYYDPTWIDGFAGKYAVGYGTPFDLDSLPDSPTLDKQNIRFIRLIDIIGNGNTKDSAGRPIYDPTPTVGSGGFDLDAIGVIHQFVPAPTPPKIVSQGRTPTGFLLRWECLPDTTYRIEQSDNLVSWSPAAVPTITSAANSTTCEVVLPMNQVPRRFWRIGTP